MRKATNLDIIFGLLSFGLIYLVVTHNASITGFVIGSPASITLISPADNTQTTQTSTTFIFQYSPDEVMKQCSLILNDYNVKTAVSLLSPYNTRIQLDMEPGTYFWSIECTDTDDIRTGSLTQVLIISGSNQSEVKKTHFPGRAGYIYEFEVKQGRELDINNVVPNDVLRAKIGEDSYDINIIRVSQDYSKAIKFTDLLITPGNKRIRINMGEAATIDFNNDGQGDINLTLDDVSYGKDSFTVSTIKENSTQPTASLETAETQKTPEKQKLLPVLEEIMPLNLWGLFLIGLIVCIIIILVSTLKNKAEMRYVTKLKSKTKAETQAKKTGKKDKN